MNNKVNFIVFLMGLLLFFGLLVPRVEKKVEARNLIKSDKALIETDIGQQAEKTSDKEILRLIKYYRSIGEHEKAVELLKSIPRNVESVSPVNQSGRREFEYSVVSEKSKETNSPVKILWDTSDRQVAMNPGRDLYPILAARHNSVNDNELYVVSEMWDGSTAPDKILLMRSMNHGYNWHFGTWIDAGPKELSMPSIVQVSNNQIGLIYLLKNSDTEKYIDYFLINMDNLGDFYINTPDTSPGIYRAGPAIASDYLDFPEGAFVYLVYYRIASPTSKLMFVRSTNQGMNWEDPVILDSFDEAPYPMISIHYDSINQTLWVAYIYKNNTTNLYIVKVLKSGDFGQTWQSVFYADSLDYVENVTITSLGNYVWLGIERKAGSGVVFSNDGGLNWPVDVPLDGRYIKLKTIEGCNYVYCAYTKNYADVIIARADLASPLNFISLGNVKNSSNPLRYSPHTLSLLVSRNPTGVYQASVSWAQEFGTDDYNIYFDAEWLPQPSLTQMAVIPTINFSSEGAQGGPFNPSAFSYKVENTGTQPVSYTVSVDQPWVTLSNTGGSLLGGAAATVTVSINSTANSLPVGNYSATVTFTNTTNGVGNATRTVSLKVTSSPAQLTVTPAQGFGFDIFLGGPPPQFSGTYTLQNTGGASLNWTATKKKNWLTLSPTSGSLIPGASTNLAISINSNCSTLPPGNYPDTINIANLTNGAGTTTRNITLTVHYYQTIIVRGSDNRIYERILNYTGYFSPWSFINGLTDKSPASAIINNRVYVFVKSDTNNDIWRGYISAAGAIGSWNKIDGATPDRPSAAFFNDKIYLAVRGNDNRIYLRSMSATGTFSSWSVVPGGWTTVAPAITAFNNYLYLIVKDASDNKIWMNKMDTNGTWVGWQLMDGMSPSPAAMAEYNGLLYIFVRGTDNRIYYRTMTPSGVLSSWTALAGWTDDSPAICSFNNLLYLWVKGLGSDDIWYNSMTATGTWGTWTKMDGASPTTATLAAPKID